jgi:hypothetical protein
MCQTQCVTNEFTLGVLRGSIYKAVKGSVYNVQTITNCPINCVVMELLQLFVVYNYFTRGLSMTDMCPSLIAHPNALGSRLPGAEIYIFGLARPLATTFDHASIDGISRLRL